ncbi:hypothetical protein AGABI2DRAFT_115479 [Agaricus bisporus var. bisporus H97]|uniref:hypothetical protein n=1 Tax=Agaricus bisporus var. bisporus (strain H97 / ATCC MYA-4626 / FGSC 10389) TaxID=936046 RepID=UPI00029F6BAB|nr:hypothetical protein AGABI2DRAFT_115479 [Agaricus bisporus var. bisporus H97]EKV50403.1 hypothetical protein AGABI2DRAFT_115479 [Agaricus bisporus var. bisporus H97]
MSHIDLDQAGDEEGICDILAICILVTSWIVPALLLIYLVGLAYRSFRHRVGRACIASDTETRDALPEGTYPKKPHLSTVFPAPVAFPPEVCNRQFVSVNSRRITMPTTASEAPSLPTNLYTPGSPARLSKRSPSAYNFYRAKRGHVEPTSHARRETRRFNSLGCRQGAGQSLAENRRRSSIGSHVMTNWDPTSAKAQLRTTIQRLGQLQVRKDADATITRKDIATLLQQGNVALARSKAQNLIHEDSLADLLEVLEQQVATLLDRFSELEQRSPPSPILLEASSNIIFAASRLQLQGLGTVSNLISARLEPEVLRFAREHRDTYVSPKVMQAALRPTPTAAHVDAYLEEVAKGHGISWTAGPHRQDLVNPLSEILDFQSSSSVNMKQLQSLCAQGIPDEPSWLRPRLWKLFMGILPVDKAAWKTDLAKQRDAYYDLVRRLLRPFTDLPPPVLPISGPDEILIKVYKHLAHIPKELIDQLDSEPEDRTACPLHRNADEKTRISFADCLDTRSQQLRRLNENDQEGTTIPSTPEIRLERDDVYTTPTTFSEPSAFSNDYSTPTTLLSSKSIALGRASQKHASALLRLLYIHASINPGNLSPYVPSLLLPLYIAMTQEVDPEDLAHVEADSFWLFEGFVAEFAELEDENSLETWLNRLENQLGRQDPQLLEQLNDIGLHPSSPHYSSRWLSSLLTHTLPLSAINPVWDVILSQPGRERGKHPRLESLCEICTAMVIAMKPLLFKQQKSSGLWEEPSDGFLEGLAILQSYPVESLGGIDTVLQLLTVDRNLSQPTNGDLKKSQPGLGSRIRVTMWKGFTNQIDSPEKSDEESDEELGGGGNSEEVDDGNDTETPSNGLQSDNLTSRIANKVWRGITNQSSMEPPPSPVVGLSPPMSPASSVSESLSSSSNQPKENLSSSAGLWAYTEKLKDSDTVAALSKISSNWRAKAMLSPWSRPKNPLPDLPHESQSAVTSPVQKKIEPEFKRSSLPVYDHSGTVYNPPPRPSIFRNPRDSFVPAEAVPFVLSPTEISLNEMIPDSGKSSGSFLERTRNLQSSLMSLTKTQNPQPPPTTTPKAGPRPLLLNSSSLITSRSSGKSRVTPQSADGGEDWADATVLRKEQFHRDSISSISSLSPSDAVSRKQTRSDYDSDTGTSRFVPLNRRSVSPMALASKSYASRPSSTASAASSEQTVPATPAKNVPSEYRDAVDVVSPNDGEVSPDSKVDLPILSERVTLTRKILRRKPQPVISLPSDTSDSSTGSLTSRAARLKNKHYPPRLSQLHMSSPSQAENDKSTSPSNLEVPWPNDDEETATTPRASTFDGSAASPSSPLRSPKNRIERARKTSNSSRPRKLSNTNKESVRRSRSDSTAEDGDDEGYDDLLSAYESEENSSAA